MTTKKDVRPLPFVLPAVFLLMLLALAVPATAMDFDGDGKKDIAVFRPTDGTWYGIKSSDGKVRMKDWGTSGDVPAWGDYDGDGKSDLAVFRPSDGNWYILRSSDDGVTQVNWGTTGDIQVRNDYDGDGKTDIAVWRPSNGTWYILRSSDGGITQVTWGTDGDRPAAGDYDGDGKADLAVFRPTDGTWYILRSSDGGITQVNWGISTDFTLPADYDGDGKTDIAVWRPSDGNWYIIRSSDGGVTTINWGTNGDSPVPGDYDGDGKTDVAVWRPSDGNWYILRSSDGGVATVNWGSNALGDMPQRGTSRGLEIGVIAARMQEVQQLFTSGNANATTLDPYFHPSYLESGITKSGEITNWTTGGEGPAPGGIMSDFRIIEVISTSPKTVHVGFVYTMPGGGQTFADVTLRKETTTWQMYGNQRVLSIDFNALSAREIHTSPPVTTYNGLQLWAGDKAGMAPTTQSIVVTGPGIATNITLNRMPSSSDFSFMSSFGMYTMTDEEIASIPDMAPYTFKLYSGSNGTGTLQYTYTIRLPKRPYMNSELSDALFPALTSPTSHALAAANPNGPLTVTYTLPTGFLPANATLHFENTTGGYWQADDWGQTTYNFNSSGMGFTPTMGILQLAVKNPVSGRMTGIGWFFE